MPIEFMGGVASYDTIVVPAHPAGFSKVFLAERRWPNVKIDGRRVEKVKYISVYQTKPISAITHYAEIERLEPTERTGRYLIILRGEPIEIEPVRRTIADTWAIQGPRYTNLRSILQAGHLAQAFPS